MFVLCVFSSAEQGLAAATLFLQCVHLAPSLRQRDSVRGRSRSDGVLGDPLRKIGSLAKNVVVSPIKLITAPIGHLRRRNRRERALKQKIQSGQGQTNRVSAESIWEDSSEMYKGTARTSKQDFREDQTDLPSRQKEKVQKSVKVWRHDHLFN